MNARHTLRLALVLLLALGPCLTAWGQPNRPMQPGQPVRPGQPPQPVRPVQPVRPGQPPQPPPEAGCAACAACGSFGAFGVMFILILVFIIALYVAWIFVALWVGRDAKARGMDNSAMWTVLVLFAHWIGLIIYIVSRPQGEMRTCRECGNKHLEDLRRCPHCRAA